MNWHIQRDPSRAVFPERPDSRTPRRLRRGVHIATICALLLSVGAILFSGAIAQAQDDSGLADEIAAIRALPPNWTDSFRADDGMWEVDEESESSLLTYATSTYRVSVFEEQIYAWGTADISMDNLFVEVDGYSVDGNPNNEFGIVLRHEDIENFLTFLVSNDGTYTVRRLEGGSWVDMVPWETSSLIDQSEGAVNRVGAYANGETLALLINGEIVATVEDDTFGGGAIGLAAGSFSEGGIEIAFDDISVWDLDNLNEAGDAVATLAPPVEESAEATAEPTAEPTEEIVEETLEAPVEEVTPELPEEPTTEAVETPQPDALNTLLQLDMIRNAEPAYTDEFRRNAGVWHLPNDETTETEIASRELSVRVIDSNWMGWARLDENPVSEFLVEVDATQVEGAPEGMLGILFHFIDDANFDFFAVSSDGHWAFWRLLDNQWQEVQSWTPSEALGDGLNETNRLGVLSQDGMVTLLINDEAVGEFEDATTEPGKIALGVGTLSQGDATVVFDNLALWSLDASSLEPSTEVSPEVVVVEPTEEMAAAPTEEATEEPAEVATEEVVTEEATAEPTEEALAEETPEPVAGSEDLSALVAAVQALDPVFTSEFRRDDGEWSAEVDEDVDHYYQSRQLHLFVDRDNWLTLSESASASGANFLAEVDTLQSAGPDVNEFGLAFRIVDTDNFYAYFISGNGYWNLSKFEDGQWITLSDWAAADAIAPVGEVNRLGVLADGDLLTLFVNGEQVGQVTDPTFADGAIALLAGTFDEPGVDVAFDNFALWELTE